MDRILTVGIDEITLILLSKKESKPQEWKKNRQNMIQTFLDKAKIEQIYGEMVQAEKSLQPGYTYSLTFIDKPFHFSISWHEHFENMGICIHFSALAWAMYQADFFKAYKEKKNAADFLRMVQSPSYTTRLSRIDFVADYKNFPSIASVDEIYHGLIEGTLTVRDCKGRNSIRTKEALNKGGSYMTAYLGSRKSNSRYFCRIYDKKTEQIQGMKSYYQEAQNCDSWIRYEVVFRHTYAQQITAELLNNVHTDYELQSFIAQKITEKYCFYKQGASEPTEYTKALLEVIGNHKFPLLRNPSPRDNDLKASIAYLKKGSGLYPTLFKVFSIWGEYAERQLLELLFAEYRENYKKEVLKNKDILLWIRKHQTSMKNETLEDYFY